MAREMAAARQRRAEKTAVQLREARVQAIRAGARPGSPREEVEERARSFYPRLSSELLEEAVTQICGRSSAATENDSERAVEVAPSSTPRDSLVEPLSRPATEKQDEATGE
jgi:hypothetical protein